MPIGEGFRTNFGSSSRLPFRESELSLPASFRDGCCVGFRISLSAPAEYSLLLRRLQQLGACAFTTSPVIANPLFRADGVSVGAVNNA